jgi:hypothetical protein
MSARLLRILFLSAWLVATGGVWDLVQVVAWGNMFSSRLATMSVREAAQQTFLPEAKCNLCLAVEDGKRAQDESAGATGGDISSKTPIVFNAVVPFSVNPPGGVSRVWVEPGYASYRREVPPCPPPRTRRAARLSA